LALFKAETVNHDLVKDGWCWWYRKYAPAESVLEGQDKKAREAKKGLWTNPHPAPPEWRSYKSSHSLV
jgi:endonuclease YncB( thermonuclease family)